MTNTTVSPERLNLVVAGLESAALALGQKWPADYAETVRQAAVRIEELTAELFWIEQFATMRAKDDSKVFGRVNRGALRNIAERAARLLPQAEGE